MYTLILKLSGLKVVEIVVDHNFSFKEIDPFCDTVKIYFIDNQKKIRIGQEAAAEGFEKLIRNLRKSIYGKMKLHESITENLGYMYNKYYRTDSDDKSQYFKVSSFSGEMYYWVGINYKIWSTYADANPYVTTWLYNDDFGNIILEVTPFYKWSVHEDEPEDPDFMTYDEFMKNYKPLLREVIPHDVALEWLEQLVRIHKSFYASNDDYMSACDDMGYENL